MTDSLFFFPILLKGNSRLCFRHFHRNEKWTIKTAINRYRGGKIHCTNLIVESW